MGVPYRNESHITSLIQAELRVAAWMQSLQSQCAKSSEQQLSSEFRSRFEVLKLVLLTWSKPSLCLQDRDFTIVFRSFGADIAQVIEEMNAFATGCHPNYPEVRSDSCYLESDLMLTVTQKHGYHALYDSS